MRFSELGRRRGADGFHRVDVSVIVIFVDGLSE
jgi:hypothetical protein